MPNAQFPISNSMKKILSSIALVGMMLLAGCDLGDRSNAKSQLKLRGIPLSCRVQVGPLDFLPSSVSSSTAMLTNDQAREWEEMALAYMEAGQLDEALAIANKMDDALTRELNFAEIAGRYVEAGNDNKAREIAASIKQYVVYKARALARIARAHAVAGSDRKAAEIFAEAEEYARSLDAEHFLPSALGYVAAEYAAAGQFEKALELADEIRELDSYSVAWAEMEIALQYAAAGQFERALQIVAKIEDRYGRGSALEKIAADATVPQLEKLVQLALAIDDNTYKTAALADLALQYIARDRFDRAWSVIQAIISVDPNSYLLANLAGRYAAAGQFERAQELAEAMGQSSAWVKEVAGGYAAAGAYDLALELANSQESLEVKIRALRAIARQYAEAGEYTRALELVETIEPIANTAYEAIEAQFIPLLKCALEGN
ncbi:MAG: hypothetical protein F6J93_16480 [Oscillatoria sp. SIO1A7]|nr:hypothetical protein [Oscillatoria sp. SIO1A7]